MDILIVFEESIKPIMCVKTVTDAVKSQWYVWCSVFQEKEHEKFAALESKARSDKNVMMARLLHAAYVGVSESLCDAMVESPVGSLVPVGPLSAGIMMSSSFGTLNCFIESSASSFHVDTLTDIVYATTHTFVLLAAVYDSCKTQKILRTVITVALVLVGDGWFCYILYAI